MKAFEGYTYLDGGICAAKGFQASGTYCGIKKAMAPDSNEGEIGKEKNDIALVVADTLCNTAAVYTQNKVKGAPILVMKKHLAATGGKARALIANSKNANTCNADGEEKAEAMCKLTADALGIAPEEVMVMSTGVIGQILPLEPIEKAIPVLCEKLSPNGNLEAATAIMTTDTVSKEVAVSFTLDGKTCRRIPDRRCGLSPRRNCQRLGYDSPEHGNDLELYHHRRCNFCGTAANSSVRRRKGNL